MKWLKVFASLCSLCLILSSCVIFSEPSSPSQADQTNRIPYDPYKNNDTATAPEGANDVFDNQEHFPVLEFEENNKNYRVAKGRLVHKIEGIRIVTNATNIPTEGGFGEYEPVCTYDSDGNETIWHYPEFVLEDGSFAEGIKLILVDISVTSHNATNWTIYDLDDEGNPLGLYADPYIFRMDGVYILETPNGEFPLGWTMHYFSERNSVTQHPDAYTIQPGETKKLTVGFLVGNAGDGSYRDLSSYWIRVPFGRPETGKPADSFVKLSDTLME